MNPAEARIASAFESGREDDSVRSEIVYIRIRIVKRAAFDIAGRRVSVLIDSLVSQIRYRSREGKGLTLFDRPPVMAEPGPETPGRRPRLKLCIPTAFDDEVSWNFIAGRAFNLIEKRKKSLISDSSMMIIAERRGLTKQKMNSYTLQTNHKRLVRSK